ncbi:MAG: SDR family oxidoreductase [Vicinamibacterales bacterium]
MAAVPAALVVGVRGPVGEAIAAGLLDRGFRVIGCGRTAPAGTLDVEFRPVDVRDEDAVRRLFFDLDREFAVPEVIVLNAARFSDRPIAMVSGEHIDDVLDTNVKGPLLVTREAIKALIRRNRPGRIVAISSVAASRPLSGAPLYGLSKGALEHLVKSLPGELVGRPITVNAIEIALFEGAGMAAGLREDTRESLLSGLSIRRPCRPSDLNNVVEFLTLPASEYITGQVLRLGFV